MWVRRRLLAVAVAMVWLTACGTDGSGARESGTGLQLSGTLDGRQLAVSDGAPRLVVGSCGPASQPSEDVCFISQGLTGSPVVLVIRNPAALEEGVSLEVDDVACGQPSACDEVTDVALVDFQVGERRQSAESGTLTLSTLDAPRRYAGSVRLRFADGRVSGQFDVVSRPD